MKVDLVWILFWIALASFAWPIWALFRETPHTKDVKSRTRPWQPWFGLGFGWLLITLLCGIILSMEAFLSQGTWIPKLRLFHSEIWFWGSLSSLGIAVLLWISSDNHSTLWWSSAMWSFGVITKCMDEPLSWLFPLFALPGLFQSGRAIFCFLRKRKNLWIHPFLIWGWICLLGVTVSTPLIKSTLVWNHSFADWNIPLFFRIGWLLILPMGAALYVTERLSGQPLYSQRMSQITIWSLLLFIGWWPLTQKADLTRWATVAGVGLWIPFALLGSNLWLTFERTRDRTVEELAARWTTMGPWLPTRASSEWLELGGWGLFLSGLSIAFLGHIVTPWKMSLMKIICLGGIIPIFISCAYTAWSEQGRSPVERISHIAYWHYLVGIVGITVTFLASGLVKAAQSIQWLNAAGRQIGMPETLIFDWQRPFLLVAAVFGFILLSAILLVTIDHLRS